jgi:hypothetical protein
LIRSLMADKKWAFFRALRNRNWRQERSAAGGSPAGAGRRFLDRTHGCSLARSERVLRQVVVGVPAVPALDGGWYLGSDTAGLELERWPTAQRADDPFDHRAGASSGGRRKMGTQRQGFDRSKGGFTTKIHLRTNAEGLPVAAEITGGEVSDYKAPR